MGTININGMTFNGNSVCVNNGKVIIDGIEVKGDMGVTNKTLNVTVEGILVA